MPSSKTNANSLVFLQLNCYFNLYDFKVGSSSSLIDDYNPGEWWRWRLICGEDEDGERGLGSGALYQKIHPLNHVIELFQNPIFPFPSRDDKYIKLNDIKKPRTQTNTWKN